MTLRRFWNADGTAEAEYVLRRSPDHDGQFTLEKQFQYRDPLRGTFLVPKRGVEFVTDLASVPAFTSWLVPKDGTHTPAALLHDALVRKPSEPVQHEGPLVTREEADLIFREAMQHLSVPLLRRWMMWSAVSLATLFTPSAPHEPSRWHWYWRVLIPIVVAALLVIGFVSVLDVLDVPFVRLPWMGDHRPWTSELLNGLGVAVLAAIVVPIPWGRRWRVGLVAVLVLIPFAFPLVVAGVAFFAYQAVEIVAYWITKLVAPPTPEDPVPAPKVLKRISGAA